MYITYKHFSASVLFTTFWFCVDLNLSLKLLLSSRPEGEVIFPLHTLYLIPNTLYLKYMSQTKSKQSRSGRRAVNQSNGYGPSYREIMRGLGYTSVSTVSAHISHLTAMGYLMKKGRSARSLHVLKPLNNLDQLSLSSVNISSAKEPSGLEKSHQKWLVAEASKTLETAKNSLEEDDIFKAKVLVEALKILGLDAAALSLNAEMKQIEESAGL